MSQQTSTTAQDALAARDAPTGGLVAQYIDRIKTGDLGSLPVILGLIVIWAIFQSQNDRFLTATNLTNLMLQITAVGTVSLGIVLVLLLGEIDLSVGFVSGLAAASMTVLNVNHGVDGYVAILAGLGVGVGVGLFQGLVITKLKVPSFIVTLAGFIGWQGALLWVLGDEGTINVTDPAITDLTSTFFLDSVGWTVAVAGIAAFVGATLWGRRQRLRAGLRVPPITTTAIRVGVISLCVLVATAILNNDRGVPLAVLIFLGLVLVFDFVVRRTTFGRHVFAVGGNAEAARRAGITVDRVVLIVFVLCSTLAAWGGIMAASRLFAVSQASGGGDFLLNAIAGAVIGGTSLFGGRGSAWSALLGALVIGSIANGMGLLALGSDVQFMVTGAVLLLAVIVDSTARRGRQAAGRA